MKQQKKRNGKVEYEYYLEGGVEKEQKLEKLNNCDREKVKKIKNFMMTVQ